MKEFVLGPVVNLHKTVICFVYPEGLKLKTDSVTDLNNMFQGNYKDTQITITEVVPVFFLLLTSNIFLFAGVLSEETNRRILRNNST